MEACIQFLLLLTAYFQGINAAFELTLVHTNDVHARFEETNTFGGACSITELSDGSCFGGVARRHHLVQTLRNKHNNLLFLDGGDQFQGTLWFNYYKGMAAAHFMNMLQYDVMVSAFNSHTLYHQCTPVYTLSVSSVTSGYTALGSGSVPCTSFMTSGNKGYRRKNWSYGWKCTVLCSDDTVHC